MQITAFFLNIHMPPFLRSWGAPG